MDISNSSNQKVAESGSEELDFLELIRVLLDYRLTIFGVSLLTIVAASLLAFTMTPIYRVEMLLAPADSGATSSTGISSMLSRLGGIPGFGAMGQMGGRDSVKQGIATLTSQKFIMDFIRDNNLLPVFFAGKWDEEREQWDVSNKVDIPTYADGYILFKQILQVEEDAQLISLVIEWRDPVQAASWANALVTRLNNQLRQSAIEEADQTISYLNQEIEKTRIVELRQAIFAMIENQINIRTVANIRDEFVFKIINPAIAPEDDRYVRPNRKFIILVGAIVGPVLGVFMSFLFFSIKRISFRLR